MGLFSLARVRQKRFDGGYHLFGIDGREAGCFRLRAAPVALVAGQVVVDPHLSLACLPGAEHPELSASDKNNAGFVHGNAQVGRSCVDCHHGARPGDRLVVLPEGCRRHDSVLERRAGFKQLAGWAADTANLARDVPLYSIHDLNPLGDGTLLLVFAPVRVEEQVALARHGFQLWL